MPKKKSRKVVYWSAYPNTEELCCTTKQEAIEEFLDDQPGYEPGDKLTLYGYAPMEVGVECTALDDLLERLDEEFGNPHDVEWTAVTERMKEAEKAFYKTVIEEYIPWACEVIEEVEVTIPKKK